MSGSKLHDDEHERDDDRAAEDDASMDAFAEALAASLRPSDIDPAAHERILARALGLDDGAGDGSVVTEASDDPPGEAPATDDELRRAEVLRLLFEPSSEASNVTPLATRDERRLHALARALRLAYAPTSIDAVTNERTLAPALALPSRITVRRWASVTAFALVAAAAAIFGLVVRQPHHQTSAMRGPALPMIEARSTMDLFDPAEPFPARGGTTSRIDKIATSRDGELRDNLFSSWGVE